MASSKTEVDSTWTAPRTWTAGELVTASMMNGMRDQLNALKTVASFNAVIDEATDYTTTATTFADVDATNLEATIVTGGGLLWVGFNANVGHSANTGRIYFDLLVDGARVGGDDGLGGIYEPQTPVGFWPVHILVAVAGLSAGSHTFKLQWKTSGATASLYAGAGTANKDVHPRFFGYEVG